MPNGQGVKGGDEGAVRIVEAERQQVELRVFHLDGAVPADHPVRAVWAFVEGVDVSGLYEGMGALEGRAGRPAIDRRILLGLWLYGTIEGVGSARALDRLSKEHLVYQWICGGVGVNYHTLADFRVRHGEALDELLTQSVASLMNEGLVQLKRVAQDGMKVRASAGASSFRRKRTLRECLKQAKEQVRELRRELEEDPGAGTRREQAARERAARERAGRVKKALERARELEKEKSKKKDKGAVRASTSDPQARVMKMGDGGWRPAYNVQLATDTKSQIIVGVDVTNQGNDQGRIGPMIDQLQERYEVVPAETLVDGGYTAHADLEAVAGRTRVYAPVPRPRDPGIDPHRPKATDSPAIAEWRKRMRTVRAKRIYKDRASTAECVNAQARNRGLVRVLVRGVEKVRAVALLYALAHNVRRMLSLGYLTAATA
ncbi:MAG: IS1182 family transposase [Acidobacteria bacterium]|nr:MAG: IS1182 family transposase [Acidobacteriota bacterium]